jgi:hypothetical protein
MPRKWSNVELRSSTLDLPKDPNGPVEPLDWTAEGRREEANLQRQQKFW